ncbi:hypothetical protein MKK75_03790 [Methylobacterium sp. J-030]|uniref:hypothetical protein n=1 Tax=Methylobacterium sp. J-030 TaxID=2836627 RepID=UPI001FB96F92|nr:hypothetical protein [Methylobacterium sp. J-030]MCJ2067937.1 hypothetical protein [Methylobacterium sp. J-030]
MIDAPLAHFYVHVGDIRTQTPKGRAETEAKAEKRGAEIERKRILAIITAPEAQYRFKTALHIALKTNMNVEEAREILKYIGLGTA